MPVFPDADAFYGVMHAIFGRLQKDPSATAAFHKRKMVVRISCTDPDVELVLDGRTNPIKATVGPYEGKVDLGLTLSANLLHGILTGTEKLKDAFMQGRIKVSGNMFRALQLADLFRKIEAIYPDALRESGPLPRSDSKQTAA